MKNSLNYSPYIKVHSSNVDFVEQLKQINSDLLASHVNSLNYLTDQQSTVSRIIASHNNDVIAETSHAITYLKSQEDHSFSRLNRKTDLKRQCWLQHFYQINQLSADNVSQLSTCSNANINSTISLSNTYFHTMVNAMLSESTLGTTNTLYVIGMYNSFSEQWKISKTLESVVKHSIDGWNGTMAIVNGEVEQIRKGVETIYQNLEECNSNVVQKYLNAKIEISNCTIQCL